MKPHFLELIMTKIVVAPGKYIQGPGEIKKLYEHTSVYGNDGIYALVDSFILKTYKELIESNFQGKDVEFTLVEFGGECSQAEIDSHKAKMAGKKYNVILGIGGGKSHDTAKAIAYELNIPVLIVPTAASTDAPTSALSVLYTPDGQFDKYLFLRSNPDAVIMDEEIIVNAPARLFVAGMGDALATYFEADATRRSNGSTIAGGKQTKTAMALATLCFDTLMSDGLKAAKAVENQSLTIAVSNVIEANTLLSGMGFESGGLAASHAIHNGMTALPQLHHLLHGEKVAFGALTQMALENRSEEEIYEVIDFCQSVGLPTTFEALGIPDVSKEDLYKIAALANDKNDTMGNMPFEVTDDAIVGAMYVVNALASHEF